MKRDTLMRLLTLPLVALALLAFDHGISQAQQNWSSINTLRRTGPFMHQGTLQAEVSGLAMAGDPVVGGQAPFAPAAQYGFSPNDCCGLCGSVWDGYCDEVHRIGCREHRAHDQGCDCPCPPDDGACGSCDCACEDVHAAPCGGTCSSTCSTCCKGRCSLGVFRIFGLLSPCGHAHSCCCTDGCDSCGCGDAVGQPSSPSDDEPAPPMPPSPES